MSHRVMSGNPTSDLWRRAVERFDARDWYSVHEILEDVWKHADATGDEKHMAQGFLLASVALSHFGNGNYRGARVARATALGCLPVGNFRDQFATVMAALDDDSPRPLCPSALEGLSLDSQVPS